MNYIQGFLALSLAVALMVGCTGEQANVIKTKALTKDSTNKKIDSTDDITRRR